MKEKLLFPDGFLKKIFKYLTFETQHYFKLEQFICPVISPARFVLKPFLETSSLALCSVPDMPFRKAFWSLHLPRTIISYTNKLGKWKENTFFWIPQCYKYHRGDERLIYCKCKHNVKHIKHHCTVTGRENWQFPVCTCLIFGCYIYGPLMGKLMKDIYIF